MNDGLGRSPLFGVIGGVASFASATFALPSGPSDLGATVALDSLHRGRYHASFVLGLIAVGSLLVASSGWNRWAEQIAPHDLAARTIGSALRATATVNVVFVSLAGALAVYLPGGLDAGELPRESLLVDHALLDFGQLLGWWGGAVAALCVAGVSLRRTPLLPRWTGVISVVLLAPPVLVAAAAGLPGVAGLFMPVWLTLVSAGLLCTWKPLDFKRA